MFHEPPTNFLYSAYLVETEHTGPDGTVKRGSATAFVLDVGGTSPYIVTNRHVLDLDYNNQPDAKYKNYELTNLVLTGRRADDSLYSFRIHPKAAEFVHEDTQNDVALIEGHIYTDGPDSLHWHFGMWHLADEAVFSTLKPFDVVCCTGFPAQHDKLGIRPLLRSGHIASDPAYDYSWDGAVPRGKCVAYEGFSFPGASGGPIFAPPRGSAGIADSRHGYLVGVNAGHVPSYPSGHSGISYFYKSTVILEIVSAHSLGGSPGGNG